MIPFLLILLGLTGLIALYFGFRYLSLRSSLKKIEEDLLLMKTESGKDMVLHLPTPDGSLSGLLRGVNSVLRDLREESLNAGKKERALKEQIENISHDLRTPLTSLLGFLKLYQKEHGKRLSEDADLFSLLSLTEKKAEALKTLVTNFYELSRIDAGDFVLTPEPLDLGRLLRDALLMLPFPNEEGRVTVSVSLPNHPLPVFSSKAALERILSNLFENASRYARSFFSLSVKEDADTFSVHFVNDGEHLTEEDVSLLFERFFVSDRARTGGSTGLGLTVAKLLAEELSGSLTASLPAPSEIPDAPLCASLLSLTLTLPKA